MKKHTINLLVLSDDDMNCDVKNKNLDNMGLENIGFSQMAVAKYDMIVYEGTKGSKILKSRYTKKGEIL